MLRHFRTTVRHDHEGRELHNTSAFDGLGYAVDGHYSFREVERGSVY